VPNANGAADKRVFSAFPKQPNIPLFKELQFALSTDTSKFYT
jgi:hypothetical protein